MYQVTLTVDYQGRRYQTNVIANKGDSSKKIERIAMQQVKKQLSA
ncbi:BA3454 family stress response protein [Bacillus sp. MUM 13]|nr:BA3454 family stress response protein [Bacillus sp. MUM 13]OIK14094.1 molecular chaperone [Bacillus sp. MUM 13]